MHKINNQKGVISIFLIIITLSVIVLAGIFVDFARVYFAQNEVNKSIELSVDSTLTNYNQKLKGLYGLYAISNSNANVIKENVLYYLTKNLFLDDISKKEKFFDPYNYIIEDLNINLQNSLDKPDILENQIVQSSRYWSSKGLANNGLTVYSSAQNSMKESIKILDGMLNPPLNSSSQGNTIINPPTIHPIKAKDPVEASNKILKTFYTKNKVSELQQNWSDINFPKSELPSSIDLDNTFTRSVIKDVYFDISKGNLNLYKEILRYFSDSGIRDLDSPNKNSLLISEYLSCAFKNYFTDKSVNTLDINGYPMINRPCYFSNNADLEYILHGRNNSDENINFVKQQILFTRFMLNLVSINMDGTKISIANDIAGSLNTKDQNELDRIRNSIILAWTLAESIIDVNLIMNDRKLPIIKDADAWYINGSYDTLYDNILLEAKKDIKSYPLSKYDFDSYANAQILEQIKDVKNIQKYKISMGYNDYIKLYTIMSQRRRLLLLTGDMVQLNMEKLDTNPDFKLKSAYSSIKANTVVSIKYFFIGRATIVDNQRIERPKRRNIEVSILRGY